MRILIIEDSEKTATFLKKGLKEKGYIVDVEYDGEKGFITAQTNIYDLIILDMMFPTMDGLKILEKLKKIKDYNTFIIVVSAKNKTTDIVHCLQLGADDYLVKPITFPELVSRIKALLRRSPVNLKDSLIFDGLKIDLNKQLVTRDGKELFLSKKEFQILEFLARNNKITVSRNELLEKIWNMSELSDKNIIEVQINRLRSKLDEGFDKKFIKTVRDGGYIFDDGID
ncbi:MAG: response regulator transcription factor [Silvanigrellaceae bacterium]|nr:response regulator transcription factor [Silvanigrellaceae bacterium]